MPLYYFNIRQPDGGLAEDDEGIELPGIDAAMAEAVASAKELAAESYRANGRLLVLAGF